MKHRTKSDLLKRRKELASIPIVDMTPKEIGEYESITKQLMSMDVEELHETLKSHGQKFIQSQKEGDNLSPTIMEVNKKNGQDIGDR